MHYIHNTDTTVNAQKNFNHNSLRGTRAMLCFYHTNSSNAPGNEVPLCNVPDANTLPRRVRWTENTQGDMRRHLI